MKRRHEHWISMVERTHLPYLPVNKGIKDAEYGIKVKFWLGCLKLWLLSSVVMVGVLYAFPDISIWFVLIPFFAINYWWFAKWNKFLRSTKNT